MQEITKEMNKNAGNAKKVVLLIERNDVQTVKMPQTNDGKPKFTSRMDGSAGGERMRPSFG